MSLTPRQQWFIDHAELLLNRAYILELFTVTDYARLPSGDPDKGIITHRPEAIPTCIATDGQKIYGLTAPFNFEHPVVLGQVGTPAFALKETLPLQKGMIANYTSETPTETTYGRFFLNYLALALPFGDKVPYVNGLWNIKKVERSIAALISQKQAPVSALDMYMNHMFFAGTMTELCVPTLTEKSLIVSPEIKKRKAELYEQHKDHLDDPVVMNAIENELIALDKAYLKDDPSMGFYGDAAKKIEVHRKKMFLGANLAEDFQSTKGHYTRVDASLEDGWQVKDFSKIANEIRGGSYSRGLETAKGGEQSKFLLRLFQNTKIVEDNCLTTDGLNVERLTPELAKEFMGRHFIQGNRTVVLTEENLKTFLGQAAYLRSMMYCKSKGGFCYKCAGEMFRDLDVEAIGVMALDIGSAFLKASLKKMHGTKSQMVVIDDLSPFFVG